MTCVVLLTTIAYGQAQKNQAVASKIYVRIGAGYAFPHAGQTYIESQTATVLSYSEVYGKYSFGAGVNATLAGGFWLNDYIGLELGIHAGIAPKKYETTVTDPTNSETGSTKVKMPVYIIPAVVLQTGGEYINVYSRLGVVVNIAGKIIAERKNAFYSSVMETTLKTGIGFHGALGVSIPVADKISIFAEANGIAMNQYLKTGEVTKATQNGVDILSQMTESEKKANFVDEITVTASTTTPNPDEPTKLPAQAAPFSNIGFGLGVMIHF